MIPTYHSQVHRDRKWNGGYQGLEGEENAKLVLNYCGFQLGKMEKALEMDGGDSGVVAQSCEDTQCL